VPFIDSDRLAALQKRKLGKGVNLSAEDKDRLVTTVLSDFYDARASHARFLDNHTRFLRNWRGIPEPDREGVFGPDSANIKTPLTTSHVEQMKARILKAIMGDGRPAKFVAMDESIDPDMAEAVTDWFNWELIEVVGIEEVFADILHYTLVDGISLPIPMYERERRRLRSKQEFVFDPAQDVGVQIQAILNVLLQGEKLAEQPEESDSEPGVFAVKFAKDDNRAKIRFALQDEEYLVAEMEREETVFDGVKVQVPNIEDIIVMNSHPDVEKIPFFGMRMLVSLDQFRAWMASKKITVTEEQYKDIEATATVNQRELIDQPITDQLDKEEGADERDSVGSSEPHRKWVEVYRWEGNWIKGKVSTPVMVMVAAGARVLLKIERLEELNKDGRRSPIKFEFIRQPNRFYSIGQCELLQNVQEEHDGIHNQSLDAGLLAVAPPFSYQPASGHQAPTTLRPGAGFPTRDGKIAFANVPSPGMWSVQAEQAVKQSAGELDGLSEGSLGSSVSKRQSASEFLGTVAAVDLRTEYIVRGMLRQFRDLLTRIFGLYQQHMHEGRVFSITNLDGEQIVREFKLDRDHGKMKLLLTGTSQQVFNQIEREISITMMQMLLSDVLMQMRIVRPDTVYAAVEKVIRAHGYKDVPLHKPDLAENSPAPEVEHDMMRRELRVTPNAGENFNEHLKEHMELQNDPGFTSMFPSPASQALLAEHIQETVELRNRIAQETAQAAQQAGDMIAQLEQLGLGGTQPRKTGQAGAGTAEEGVAQVDGQTSSGPLN